MIALFARDESGIKHNLEPRLQTVSDEAGNPFHADREEEYSRQQQYWQWSIVLQKKWPRSQVRKINHQG